MDIGDYGYRLKTDLSDPQYLSYNVFIIVSSVIIPNISALYNNIVAYIPTVQLLL